MGRNLLLSKVRARTKRSNKSSHCSDPENGSSRILIGEYGFSKKGSRIFVVATGSNHCQVVEV